MSVGKSSKPRSDACSCSTMYSCVPRPTSGEGDHDPQGYIPVWESGGFISKRFHRSFLFQISGWQRQWQRKRNTWPEVPSEVERASELRGGAWVRVQRRHGRHRPLPSSSFGRESGDQRQAKYDAVSQSGILCLLARHLICVSVWHKSSNSLV